jgi:hypothetical protein
MTRRSRYAWSLAAAFVSLIAVNIRQYYTHTSADFYVLDGWPSPFFNEGGFAHDTRFIWFGLSADLLVVIVVGLAIGASWSWFADRRINANPKTKSVG